MAPDIVQVDAFTDRPFAGNPAAVCVLDTWPSDGWMQAVAAEMALSETAFAVGRGTGYGLRWFTPTTEVDLCGHATLATAHVLWTERGLPEDTIRFATRSGELLAHRRAEGWIELDLPADPAERIDPPDGLGEALGVDLISEVGRTPSYLLVQLATAGDVRALQPDLDEVARLAPHALVVTAFGDGRYDMASRVFGPAVGIDEDPVTGSAHCVLGPWWAARLGRTELLAQQVSARGGELRIVVAGDRVLVAGQAVTVMRGALGAEAAPAD